MKRLTRKTEEEFAKNNGIHYLANATSKKVLNKLGEYEDAEEQGLLLRLLCNINDIVFTISKINLSIELLYVENICLEKYEKNIYIKYTLRTLDKNGYEYRYNSDFGKTVFLTEEEAEQALAKMKEV